MAQALDRWLGRYFGEVTEDGDHARTIKLTSGDGSTTWDTWEVTPDQDLPAELQRVAEEVAQALKALEPELPKGRRTTFLVTVNDNQGRPLGQIPKTVIGQANDGGIQASSADAMALAMKAIADLWQISLNVTGNQLQASYEENGKLRNDLHEMLQTEIERKKTESESTVLSNQQTERIVGVAEQAIPELIQMGQYYLKKEKKIT